MVGHGGSSAGSYLTDPTSPIPSPCTSIVVTSTLRVKCTLIFSKTHLLFDYVLHIHSFCPCCCDVQVRVPDPEVVAMLEMTQKELEAMRKAMRAMRNDKAKLKDKISDLEGQLADSRERGG